MCVWGGGGGGGELKNIKYKLRYSMINSTIVNVSHKRTQVDPSDV